MIICITGGDEMLKINWNDFYLEEEKIEQLDDETEKEIRYHLLDDIHEKINDYNIHLSEYEYTQHRKHLTSKGINFIPLEKASLIKAKWSKIFAASASAEEKKNINFNQFRWHLFSFNILQAIKKEDARNHFNKCLKEKVYMFYQHNDEAYIIENAHLLKSTDFDMDTDAFIFDEKEKWTYIHTHEEQCGPYFYCVE